MDCGGGRLQKTAGPLVCFQQRFRLRPQDGIFAAVPDVLCVLGIDNHLRKVDEQTGQ
jgi:hypothetical protein